MTDNERLNLLLDELKKRNIVKNKKEFSNILGIDEKNLAKYLNGDIKPYGIIIKNYDKLSSLNISLDWLLAGKGSMFNESHSNDLLEKFEECKEQLTKLTDELDDLKKSVAFLEKENKDLNKEIIEKLKELTKVQSLYIDLQMKMNNST